MLHDSALSRRPRRGYTLIEILVVLGILVVLFAVLLPVLISAKDRSKSARALSDLHQLGLAANLYHEQKERWPLGTPDLVNAGLAPSTLAVSVRDPSPRGQANDLVLGFAHDSNLYKGRETSYRRTYVGLYDYGHAYRDFERHIENQPAAGWLVDCVDFDLRHMGFATDRRPTTYRRLTLESSVVPRRYDSFISVDGRETYADDSLFADGDLAWKRSLTAP